MFGNSTHQHCPHQKLDSTAPQKKKEIILMSNYREAMERYIKSLLSSLSLTHSLYVSLILTLDDDDEGC